MFPTCPACKQSVLEDDVEDCPFCGANLKTGKPGKAKPAPAAKPASKKKSSLDDDDDPFSIAEMKATPAANVPRVSPRKDAKNTHPVSCPMCETTGFVSPDSIGQDVRCPNPRCPVPVYTVPRVTAPAPSGKTKAPASTGGMAGPAAPAEPKAPAPMVSPNNLIFGAIGSVAFVAVVSVAYYFMTAPPADKPPVDIKTLIEEELKRQAAAGTTAAPPVTDGMTANNDPANNPPTDSNTNTPTPVPTNPATTTAPPVATTANSNLPGLLQEMVKQAISDNRNRSKPFCRRMTAQAYALTGDVPGTREQLDRLQSLSGQVPYYKLDALMVLAWNALKKGDAAGAKALVVEALPLSASVPKVGRDASELLLEMSALLAATGQVPESAKMIQERLKSDEEFAFVAETVLARAEGSFDLQRPRLFAAIGLPTALPWVAVVELLGVENQLPAAEALAKAGPNPEIQAAMGLAVTELQLRKALQAKDDAAAQAAEKGDLVPALAQTVRLPARLALVRLEAGDRPGAERLLAQAVAASKTITPPPPIKCPDFKSALDLKLPEPAPLRQNALGLAAIAQAQVALGQTKEAWESSLISLQLARAMAPSPEAYAALNAEADQLGVVGLRAAVRKLLNLKTDDEARRKASELRGKLTDLGNEAQARFQIQIDVLSQAIIAGLAKEVWEEVSSLTQRDSPDEREPYFTSRIPWSLRSWFLQHNQAPAAKEIATALEQAEVAENLPAQMTEMLELAFASGNQADAAAECNNVGNNSAIDSVILRQISMGATRDQLAQSIQFAGLLTNGILKEDVVRLTCAAAARNGRFAEAKTILEAQTFSATEKLSGYLGLVQGEVLRIAATPVAPPAAPPAQTPPVTK